MSRADMLREQLDQVERDLEDVATQVEVGELDAPTAEELQATYRVERRDLERLLDEIESGAAAPSGADRRRVIAGSLVLLAGFAIVTVILLNTVRERQPGELVTGGVAADVVAGEVDLASISNEEMEAVVAENPDVAPMRLALARRYFEAGDFTAALPHFMTVLEQDTENAEALASVGWMTYLSDPARADVASAFVERAVAAAPEYAQAHWFLGNIRLFGFDDRLGAAVSLETLLGFDSVPDDIRQQAEQLLEDLR